MSPLPGSSITHPRLHEHAVGWRARGLPDQCMITRAGGDPILDPHTAVLTPVPRLEIYEGACSVQPAPATQRNAVVGDTRITVRKYVVSIDDGSAEIDVDDIVTVTASADTHLVGRALLVTDVTYDTFGSRRLLFCEDRPGINP